MVHISTTIVGCVLTMFFIIGLWRVARYSVSILLDGLDNQAMIFCGTIAYFYWFALTVSAWLLLFGYFGRIPFILVSLAGMVFCFLNCRFSHSTSRSAISDVLMQVIPVKFSDRVLYAIVLLLTSFTCIRALLAPIHGWDASTYHLPKSVWWVKYGVMKLPEFPGGWEFHKYEFGAAELLHALIMIPFGTPLLVNLPDVIAYILCGLVSILIVDRLMPFKRARYLALILVLSSPTLKLLVGSCYVELHAVVLVLCAFLPFGDFFFHAEFSQFIRRFSSCWLPGSE